jgi:hypothetical protein
MSLGNVTYQVREDWIDGQFIDTLIEDSTSHPPRATRKLRRANITTFPVSFAQDKETPMFHAIRLNECNRLSIPHH